MYFTCTGIGPFIWHVGVWNTKKNWLCFTSDNLNFWYLWFCCSPIFTRHYCWYLFT